jgi:hypothetical protein
MSAYIYRGTWKGFVEIIKYTSGHNTAATVLGLDLTDRSEQ